MFCGNCGAKIEEGCKFCVACGTKVEMPTPQPEVSVEAQPVVPVEPAIQQPIAQVQYQPAAVPNSFDYNTFVQPSTEAEPPKKAKRGKKWLKATVAVVLVISILAGTFFALKDYIIFGFMGMMPAKTQLQYVYSRAAGNVSKDFGVSLDNVREFVTEDETIKGDVKLKLGDGINTMLSNLGVGLGNFDTVAVNYNLTKKDGLTRIALDIGDGKAKIMGADVCYDSKKGKITVSVPELNGDVLEIDIEDYVNVDKEAIEQINDYYATVLPSSDLLEKLLPKYIKIAFKQITNVNRSSDTLTVKGVSQKTTRLDAIIDEDTVENMLVAMAKEIRNDKDIKEYIYNLAEKLTEIIDDDDFDDTPADFYEEFIYEIDDLIEKVEDLKLDFDGTDIVFTTHADARGDIVGVGITVERKGKEIVAEYAMVESHNELGILGRVALEDIDLLKLEGHGNKSGDAFTGSIDLVFKDTEMMSLKFTDFDFEAFIEGYPKGKVEVELDGALKFIFGGRVQNNVMSSASASLKFEFDCTKKKTVASMAVKFMGLEVGEISINQTKSRAEKITLPAETEDNLTEWVKDIEIDKIKDNLEDSGLYKIIENILRNTGNAKDKVAIEAR